MTASPPRLLLAVAVGGAVGALARWALSEAVPIGATGFPWTTLAINATGSFLLALLPASARVRQRRTLAVGLGPGLLGGFTTLSATSEEARALLASGHTPVAAAYLLATLAACLVAVAVAERWSTARDRRDWAAQGGAE